MVSLRCVAARFPRSPIALLQSAVKVTARAAAAYNYDSRKGSHDAIPLQEPSGSCLEAHFTAIAQFGSAMQLIGGKSLSLPVL